MTQTQADYEHLDDTEFIEERRHVREQLEQLPEQHPRRRALTELSQVLDREFTRRARAAWSGS
jgi:pyruvate-formate lyase